MRECLFVKSLIEDGDLLKVVDIDVQSAVSGVTLTYPLYWKYIIECCYERAVVVECLNACLTQRFCRLQTEGTTS